MQHICTVDLWHGESTDKEGGVRLGRISSSAATKYAIIITESKKSLNFDDLMQVFP